MKLMNLRVLLLADLPQRRTAKVPARRKNFTNVPLISENQLLIEG